MSSLRIEPGQLVSKVNLPTSKSYANRALILAATSPKLNKLSALPKSDDVVHLLDAFEVIGLKFTQSGDAVEFHNTFPECEVGDLKVEVGEGGTTARFLAAMLLLGKKRYQLVLGGRLKDRPWSEFIELVNALGGKASLEENILSLQGPVKLPTEMRVDCSKTTQFATAFQLAYPNTKIIPDAMESSQSYWNMTLQLLEKAKTVSEYSIPIDWSSASYPLAFASLNQTIHFPELKFDQYQADAKFINVLKAFGSVEEHANGITINPLKDAKNIEFDVQDALDLVPTLGFYLAHIKGTHRLHGVKNLVHKESDRLGGVIELLKKFGRKAWVEGDVLLIEGHQNKLSERIELQLENDHRMVMVGTLFLLHHAGGSVSPAAAVNKSYPEFFELIDK